MDDKTTTTEMAASSLKEAMAKVEREMQTEMVTDWDNRKRPPKHEPLAVVGSPKAAPAIRPPQGRGSSLDLLAQAIDKLLASHGSLVGLSEHITGEEDTWMEPEWSETTVVSARIAEAAAIIRAVAGHADDRVKAIREAL
jgi:hypothetical protein